MSCDTRVLKILQCDWSEAFWAITQTQNYSGYNGDYINFYSKLVPKLSSKLELHEFLKIINS